VPAETIGVKSHKAKKCTSLVFEAFGQWIVVTAEIKKKPHTTTTNKLLHSPLLHIIMLAVLEVFFMIVFQMNIIHELDCLIGGTICLPNVSLEK